ncbi:MAG: DUF1501 domain-containing protein [Thiolinea sp.]
MINRRQFLKGLGLTTLSALLPRFAIANSVSFSRQRRLLVLIELKGANDGLNTLIPYSQSAYYDARPNLALKADSLHKLSADLALHPELGALVEPWNAGEFAWIQGVGYPQPNRSHFESIEIWDSASADHHNAGDGWIASCFPGYELGGIAVDTNLGPLFGEGFSALSISDPQRFIKRGQTLKSIRSGVMTNDSLRHILDVHADIDMMADVLSSYLADIPEPRQSFAKTPFGRSLNSVYTLVASGIDVPAYKTTLGGFDTHVSQLYRHRNLLQALGEGIAALRTNLSHLNMWDETVVMTYSEFGRRVKENSSKGTDHGTAAPHMVLGGRVKGGFYGEYPSLTDLDERGDLIYTTDFRDMYATIREGWWGLASDGKSQSLGFI